MMQNKLFDQILNRPPQKIDVNAHLYGIHRWWWETGDSFLIIQSSLIQDSMRCCSVCVCVYYQELHSDRDPVYPRSQCDHKVTYNPPLAVILYGALSLSTCAHTYLPTRTTVQWLNTWRTKQPHRPLLSPCCAVLLAFDFSLPSPLASLSYFFIPVFFFFFNRWWQTHTNSMFSCVCVCTQTYNRCRLNTHIYRLFLCALYIYMCVWWWRSVPPSLCWASHLV